MSEVKRKCQACLAIKNRELMHKITYFRKEKKLLLNPNSKTCGHSIYICRGTECVSDILKKKIIQKKFSKYNPQNIDVILDELKKIM